MKKSNIFLSALLFLGLAFTSCGNDQEMPPISYPDGGSAETVGNGDWDNPYAVWQVLAGVITDTDDQYAWTTGYIVGFVDSSIASKLNEKTATFGTAGAPNSNILMADDPNETDWTKCIPVQLAWGTSGRDLSLASNPDYLGRQVTVYGQTGTRYLTVYGLHNVNNYNFGPEGIYIAPPKRFARTTELVDGGKYLLVAGGKYIANPIAENRTYGYLYVTEKTAAQTVLSSEENAFTFTAQDGSWLIQDSFGRYMYLSGTSQSFDVSYDLPASNYLWDVVFNEDGTATIKNATRGTWMQYSTQYSSYGCYPDARGLLPVLYVEQE